VKHKKRGSQSSNPTEPKVYYPIFLNLKNKVVVIIGGGKVAERKALTLLKTGADLTVISPVLTKKLEREKVKGRIKHIRRQYRKGDLKSAFLVIAATDFPVTNEQVSKDAPCLVNVVDTPHLCNFIVPSVIKRNPLTIAVSTSSISPALSRSIRKELEKMYGSEFSHYLKLLRRIRTEAMIVIKDKRKRGEFLKAIASEKISKMLREKGYRWTKRVAHDLLRTAKVKLPD
jgi:precorrin-2 dehydrogenase/sirohydrochlorin ferrochelatase